MKRGMQFGVCVAVVGFAAACATTKVPAEKVTSAKASVRAAEQLKAENDPQAALHLQLARDEVTKAETLLKKEKNDKALTALERATADAELALRLGKLSQVREQAEMAQQRFEQLQTNQPGGMQQPATQPGMERGGSSGSPSPTHMGTPGSQTPASGQGTMQRSPNVGAESPSDVPSTETPPG